MRCLFVALLLGSPLVQAGEVLVAVASNFYGTAQKLAEDFRTESGHSVRLSSGSTGQHYAQILHGAPFQVFLAADELRPELLQQQGIGVEGSRQTYALGRLVVWSNQPLQQLGSLMHFDRLAIANPRLAPYGEAAIELLDQLGGEVRPKLVMGENVSQAFQFVATGAVAAGMVSMAQLLELPADQRGYYLPVPPEYYGEIRQQMLLLDNSPAAQAFHQYLQSPRARQLIENSGYLLPPLPQAEL